MTAAIQARGNPADKRFLGHPRGLAYLAFTEAWERFSFYGMQALLLLYMIQHLLTPDIMGSVLGLGQFRSMVEAVTGPLSHQSFAAQVFGLYTGLVYFTPVFGGLLADRLLGQRRTVLLGAALMALGHVLMAFESAFLMALLLLIVGSGLLKGNISVQVGHLYGPQEEGKRSRGFVIFSAAINIGGLIGPVICALLAQAYGWHVGFGAAGLMMLLAMAIYVAGSKYLPADVRRVRGASAGPALTGHDWRVIAALVLVSVIAILPSLTYNQAFISGLLMIEESVDRQWLGRTISTNTFNALDGLFCVILVPPLVMWWRWQARRGREPDDLQKIAWGYLITAIASALMVLPAMRIDSTGATVGIVWPVLLFALNALGFLYYWPTLLALYSRAAPAAVNSTMMGVLFFSTFIGNVLSGTLAALWETMSHARFFWLHAALAFVPFIAMLLVARPLRRLFASQSAVGTDPA